MIDIYDAHSCNERNTSLSEGHVLVISMKEAFQVTASKYYCTGKFSVVIKTYSKCDICILKSSGYCFHI